MVTTQQRPTTNVLGTWFRQMATVLGGIAAMGAVTWVISKQFFVTRDEYVQIYVETKTVANKLDTVEASLKEQRAELRDISAKLGSLYRLTSNP